jgi:hypothetical protein
MRSNVSLQLLEAGKESTHECPEGSLNTTCAVLDE